MKSLVVLLLGCLLSISVVHAQTVQTTPNLINSGAGSWTGATNSTTIGGGYSGGGQPAYNASNNIVYFGYTTSTVAQTIAINNALQGSGVQVGGYNYSWMYLNNSSTGGTLSSTVKLTSPTGSTLEQYNYAMNQVQDGWRTVQGSQNFNQQYGLADVGNLSISFTGKDARFWAGYYGPQVKDVNLSLNYTVDPCVANPLYSPSCAGYNNVITSQTIYAQSYAINQALASVGAGVQINGFRYGYDLYVGGDWCYFGFIVCFDTRQSSMAVDVNVTSNTGSSLYSATHDHNQQNTFGSYSYSYVFPSQRTPESMGNFSLSARQFGTGALYSSWSNWQYTPDPCTVDPLSSQSCPGYQAAFLTQQCTANPLYNSACPGYAQAMFTQQCSANPLMDPSCPGYASAYLTYQCSVNPLYSTTCAGYETAYFDQQCSISALYSSRCPNYATAYKNQQCTLNPLYATDCTGYASAYHDQQCSISPLYMSDCPGYQTAYFSQQCTLNGLYDRTCPNYSEAYAKKMLLEKQGLAETVATAGVIAQTAPSPTSTTASTTSASTSISSDGSVSVGVSKTGDTNIDKAIAPPAPSTNSAGAPAPVQLVQAPPPAAAPAPPAAKNDGGGERKPEGGEKQGGSGGGDKPAGPNQQAQSSDKPAAPTARQEIQERRQAAAKAEAVEKGKNLANEMGKAADMESQKQIQNVVIQAMGFTPGFDTYNKAMLPDGAGYRPYSIYGGQKVIENRATLRMFGGTDRVHNEMIESQYSLGNYGK